MAEDQTPAAYGPKIDKGPVAFVGNVGKDGVKLAYDSAGKPYAQFSVGAMSRVKDDAGAWVNGETAWHDVVVFKSGGAENVAESFQKGSRVVVVGRLQEQEVTKGDEITVRATVLAEEVGASTRWAAVQHLTAERSTSAVAEGSSLA